MVDRVLAEQRLSCYQLSWTIFYSKTFCMQFDGQFMTVLIDFFTDTSSKIGAELLKMARNDLKLYI